MTLPLIYTLQIVNSARRNELIRTVEKHNKDKARVRDLIQQVHQSGGIHYAQKVMEEYMQRALTLLQEQPQSSSRESMFSLVDYVIKRES